MNQTLRILFVEDSFADVELEARELRRSGLVLTERRVQTKEDLIVELDRFGPDLVISDYNMPAFDGLQALSVVRMQKPSIPFIFVSGSIGEERAIEALKNGATDYVLKDRMARLAPCVHRALRELEDRAERRRAEAEIERFFALSLDLLCIADFGGYFKQLNPAWESVLGFTRDELRARPFIEFVHPEDRPRTMAETQKLMEDGKTIQFENRCLRKDGSCRWLSWSAAASREDRLIYAAARDITERRQLEEQLRQSQKMEAVGHLAGGVAHDFNNMITAITGYSDLLLMGLKAGDPMRADVEEIKKAGMRAAGLTRQLLAFSRKQIIQPRVLDLNAVILDLNKMLVRLLGVQVQLAFTPGEGLGLVRADPGLLEQVLVNLAVNARDAMPEGGKLSIETGGAELDEGFARKHPGAQPGPYVRLSVSDDGSGMDADTLARIFEPFFTTKGPGKGTGLGLSTVYGIVKQSGGFVTVDSEPGRGTTFSIYLPRTPAERPDAPAAPEAAPPQGGRETLLLIEDDPQVGPLMRRLLSGQGYTLLEARTSNEALEACERHAGPIHAAMIDMVLPGSVGPDIARRLQERRPGLKVLYISGHTDDLAASQGLLESGAPFLQKPFTRESLSKKVRDVLAP